MFDNLARIWYYSWYFPAKGNHMKRLFLVAVAVVLAASLSVYAVPAQAVHTIPALSAHTVHSAPAQADFDNFVYLETYTAGQFRDVRDSDWFARYVKDAYNLGFLRGKSDGVFDPGGYLTLGEAVTLAARVRSIYHTGSAVFPESVPFYSAYADYAISHGIIDAHCNYSEPATRGSFAAMMHNALPPDAFQAINEIPDYGICDVAPDSAAGAAVYALYRAGILSGSDQYGTFHAGSYITRAETCAVLTRLADPAIRTTTLLPTHVPVEVIFQRNANAVFMLEMFDEKGDSIRTGSGFFISSSGLAVTNLHVIDSAASATITLYSGEVFQVRGIHAFSDERNLVIFSVDSEKGGWSFLTLADSSRIEAGNSVYALGSPRELINTISEGIISYSRREVNWDTLIQFTAPISFGSGGSPLLNTLGQVVGVAASTYTYGQNLNLAVPINFVKELEPGNPVALEEFSKRGQ